MSPESLIDILTVYVYPAVLVLFFFGLTIFIHELGHFLMARREGMVIERFSVGFGPKIWGKVKNGVDYRVSWLPFGGYVALPQMSPVEALEGKTQSPEQELPLASPKSKILVAVSGPLMNIVLAFVLACVIWSIGMPMPNNSTVVGWVEEGSAEELAGIQPGDRIVQINGHDLKRWTDVTAAVATSLEPTVKVTVERGDKRLEFPIETKLQPDFSIRTINLYSAGRPYARKVKPDSPAARAGIQEEDQFLAIEGVPIYSREQLRDLIGKRADKPTELKIMRGGEVQTVIVTPEFDPREKAGRMNVILGEQIVRPGPTPVDQFTDVLQMLGNSVYALAHSKQTGVSVRSFSGPVGIMGGWWAEFAFGGVRRGLWLAVILNINLAIINLLPIPVLDGGHILFSLIEAVRRRPVNARVMQAASTAFAVLIIGFMLYITVFDIQKLMPSRAKHAGKPEINETNPAAEPAPAP